MTGHIHLQLDLGMLEKREKLLAIYDVISPRVWAEMDLLSYATLPNFRK